MPSGKYIRRVKNEGGEEFLDKSLKEYFEMFRELRKLLREYQDFLKKSTSTNENIEKTLLNVLLAIRQNEYLQAWYPEQLGFPSMKVSGIHPVLQPNKSINNYQERIND
jgi:N-glycosylase/DNA lyase